MTTHARSLGSSRPMWLAGHPAQRHERIDVVEKFTRQIAGQVSRASADDVDAAIHAAVRAVPMMRRWPAWRRRDALTQVSRRLEELADEFARVLVIEVGKPLRDAHAEVDRAVETFRVAAEESTRIGGELLPLDVVPRGEGLTGIVRRFPIGPCAFITPFNFPLNLIAHKIAPAIASGCPFVLKPASSTPVSALMLGDLLAETEIPPDAFSILPCGSDVAAPLIDDDRLVLLSFTGSAEVGWSLRSRAARKRHVTLELGGNAACIVDRGTDIAHAAARIVTGAFGQAGQSCISVQRILAHRDVYEELRDELVARTRSLCIGDPFDEGTDVGPMISLDDAARVEHWIAAACNRGARLLCGGRRMGATHEPTLLENAPHDSDVSCQEVFGPVATLEPFADFDHAIARANASRFGLQAGLFTNDLHHVMRAFEGLEVGGVIVGDVPSLRIDSMPYGGVKDSGVGREGVRYAILEMTEPRLLVLRG